MAEAIVATVFEDDESFSSEILSGSISSEIIIGFIRLMCALEFFGLGIFFSMLTIARIFVTSPGGGVLFALAGLAIISLLIAKHFFKACSERYVED